MVNTGKPSAGCDLCRARHVKCDEAKPRCMRCHNAKRICPGYRDLSKIRFRGNTSGGNGTPKSSGTARDTFLGEWLGHGGSRTEDVVARSHFFDISPSPTARTGGHLASPTTVVGRNHLPSMHLTVPNNEVAQCFFLANFVLLPGGQSTMGHLHWSLPLLETAKQSSPLQLAFLSVSLASLGARQNSKALLSEAKLNYVKALKQMNSALADPKLSKWDPILATILLLTVFEQVTLSERDQRGWRSHIDGAVALMTSGRRRLFKTKTSQDLFLAVRELMTVQYIGMARAPIPGVYWWIHRVPEDPMSQRYAILNLYVAELRADNDKTTTLAPRNADNTEKVLAFLKRAEELEQQYREWYDSQGSLWAPTTAAWINNDNVGDLATSKVFPGRLEVFSDLTKGYKYNIARAAQIFIWTSILRSVAWMGNAEDYMATSHFANARQRCAELIEGIVASVPYFLGWKGYPNASIAGASYSPCGNDTQAKTASVVFILFPMFVAIRSDFATPEQRTFMKGKLKHIAENEGVSQASMLLATAPLLHPSAYIEGEQMNLMAYASRAPGNNEVDMRSSFFDLTSTTGQLLKV